MSHLKWDQLLAEQRLRELLGGSKSTKVAGESRSEYERDRDRTVGLSRFYHTSSLATA